MFLRKISIVITFIIVLLAGCEEIDPNNPANWPEWDEHNPPPPELLEMKLVEVPNSIEQGQTVEFTMEVTNTSELNFILMVRGPQSDTGYYDFMVTGGEDKLYWSHFLYEANKYSEKGIKTTKPSGMSAIHLNAGKSLILSRKWNGKDIHGDTVESGRYKITGLYEVIFIENKKAYETGDKEILEVKDNSEVGHYTTDPKEIVITSSEE